jgi:hypothetical protein
MGGGGPAANALECSQDGQTWTRVCDVRGGGAAQATMSIPETTAKYFRLTVRNPQPRPMRPSGSNLGFGDGAPMARPAPAPAGTRISEFVVWPSSWINRAEDKAGFTAANNLMDSATKASAGEVFPSLDDVVDLTDKVDASGRLRYRHFVVVQDDYEPLRRRRTVVERLETRAVRKRRVAYDGDDMLLAAAPVARGREPLGDGKRDARMPRYGGIGLGFCGIGKAGDPAHLAKRPEIAVSSGENLPCVCLVSDVPHDAVGLRVEDLRKGHRDLDGAERGRKMPAVLRNGL